MAGSLSKTTGVDAERTLLLLVVILAGTTFWFAPRLPMVDLPQHAAQVAVWHDLLTGTSKWDALLHVNYFTPYLVGYGLAAVVLRAADFRGAEGGAGHRLLRLRRGLRRPAATPGR